jgi:beta-lactamase regulating signal transducer with metallopeptidase domain
LGSRIPAIASVIVLAAWLIIAAGRLSVLLFRVHGIRQLKQNALPADAELTHLFQQLMQKFAIKRQVALKVSTAHRSPVLLGFLHPVVLLPAQPSPKEAGQILRHELAHVQRRDDWANLVQHVVHAVLFFHPGVWWISKRLTLEREIACDDQVLQQSGQPRAYALLLANLAGRMQERPALLAPGASTNKGQLQQRIDMILDTKRNTSPRLAKGRWGFITSAAALVAWVAIYAGPRVVLAQNETPPPDGPALAPAPVAAPGIAAAGALAPAPVVIFSAPDAPAATPAPSSVGEGPKYKRAGASSAPWAIVAPAVPGVPANPAAPAAVTIAPVAPMPMIATMQALPDRPGRPPRPARASGADSALEERLARLEQLVQSLVAQQNDKNFQFHFKGPEGMIDRKEVAKIEEFARKQADIARQQAINPKDIEKMQEMAERQAKVAIDQAKRATKEAERAARADQKRQFNWKSKDAKDAYRAQLDGLRRQLETLEREREKLDRQIEQLEQKQEQLDEQQDEDQASTESSEESPAECNVKLERK